MWSSAKKECVQAQVGHVGVEMGVEMGLQIDDHSQNCPLGPDYHLFRPACWRVAPGTLFVIGPVVFYCREGAKFINSVFLDLQVPSRVKMFLIPGTSIMKLGREHQL